MTIQQAENILDEIYRETGLNITLERYKDGCYLLNGCLHVSELSFMMMDGKEFRKLVYYRITRPYIDTFFED